MITAECCHSENARRLRLISPTSPQNFFLVDEGNCPKKIAYSDEDGKRELKSKSTLIEKLIFPELPVGEIGSLIPPSASSLPS